MTPDERELLQEAMDGVENAVYAIGATFTSLRSLVEEVEQEPTPAERMVEECQAAKAAWARFTLAQRTHLTLELLGDDRLTVRELTERFCTRLPECRLYDSNVRALVGRLFTAGELDRVGERYRKGDSIRYRYFRRPLSGPIADLDREFDAPTEEA